MKEKSTAVQNERRANRRIPCLLIRKGRRAVLQETGEIATLRAAFQDLISVTIVHVNGYKQFTLDCIDTKL